MQGEFSPDIVEIYIFNEALNTTDHIRTTILDLVNVVKSMKLIGKSFHNIY